MSDLELHNPSDSAPLDLVLCRRSEPRHSCERDLLVRFVVCPGFANIRAYVRDLSRAGIGLIVHQPLVPGMLLALRLSDDSEIAAPTFRARVVQVTDLEDQGWLAGCELLTPLRERELAMIVDWFI
jgi:hypothetical protein